MMKKSNSMKRMAIVAACVGMVGGSGGLVQAMKKGDSVRTQMVNVPASKIKTMPSWEDKIISVNLRDFQIGKAEVTGALWGEVYNWAISNGYRFKKSGQNVGTDKPVTGVSWHDAIVWTNAYSQKSKLKPVYWGEDGKVLKDAENTDALNMLNSVIKNNNEYRLKNDGYRLPVIEEWVLAARWLGTTKPTQKPLATKVKKTIGKDGKWYYWTPSDYASGATNNVENKQETARVAWFGGKVAQKVCTKAINILGICDMSGNVDEWQFMDSYSFEWQRPPWYVRGTMGGSYENSSTYVHVDSVSSGSARYSYSGLGFRVVRSAK